MRRVCYRKTMQESVESIETEQGEGVNGAMRSRAREWLYVRNERMLENDEDKVVVACAQAG